MKEKMNRCENETTNPPLNAMNVIRNAMTCKEMKRVEMKWNMKRMETNWTELSWTELSWNTTKRNCFNSNENANEQNNAKNTNLLITWNEMTRQA